MSTHNPQEKPTPPFPEQQQNPPGLESEMNPKPVIPVTGGQPMIS
jgi:hypothetical protein